MTQEDHAPKGRANMIKLVGTQLFDSYDSGAGHLTLNGERDTLYLHLRKLPGSALRPHWRSTRDEETVGVYIEINARTLSVEKVVRFKS